MQYYELAARLEPDYALAHAGIALVWGGRAQMGYVSMDIAGSKGKVAAKKALQLDSTLAEVHYMMAIIYAWGEWKWDLAVREHEKTIELSPNMAKARAYYSHVLFVLNRPDYAMEQIERALELDPFNILIHTIYSMDLMYLKRYDDVIDLLQEKRTKAPKDPIVLSKCTGLRISLLARGETWFMIFHLTVWEHLPNRTCAGSYSNMPLR